MPSPVNVGFEHLDLGFLEMLENEIVPSLRVGSRISVFGTKGDKDVVQYEVSSIY
jgi:hypothetical protein